MNFKLYVNSAFGVNRKQINVGVPRGSCIGPLSFLLYVNDLPQTVENSTIAVYTEDTSLSYRSIDVHQLNDSMSKDLTTVFEWLNGKKLSLNMAETKVMIIATKLKERCLVNNNEELSLIILEKQIDNVLAAKYLVGKIISKFYQQKVEEQLVF